MCGLYGIFGPGILRGDLEVFRHLAYLNMFRGEHSTGVARVWKNHHGFRTEIRKDTVPANEFYKKGDNGKVLDETFPVAVLGHNRYATIGKRDDIAGAHPFENNRFIGFHNGTLKDKKYTDDRKFFTDSESLYADLAESENPQKILEELEKDSAFALAYFDKHKGQVGFVRNEHRSLWFATNQKRSVCYYSSEIEMLRFALDRCDIDYETYQLAPWKHISIEPNAMNFVEKSYADDSKYRVNTWYITSFKPNPPAKVEPPHNHWKNRHALTYPRGGAFEPLRCKMCNTEVEYANGLNDRKKEDNPVYINNFGLCCKECNAQIEEMKKQETNHPLVVVH